MRKGVLEFCILSIIRQSEVYPSEIIEQMKNAGLSILEGTLYPLLTRLKNAELLSYRWEESVSGPPRKYFSLTEKRCGILPGTGKYLEAAGRCREPADAGTESLIKCTKTLLLTQLNSKTMNKIININLAGRLIPIDEAAYDQLRDYLNRLKLFFSREEGGDEILRDTGGRASANLFRDKLKKMRLVSPQMTSGK